MLSNQKLFSVGTFDFRLQHLLIIGILILSFSITMLIRSTPLSHGFELFEFDPFFNYRGTEYVVENGYQAYFEWIDEKSWHPYGRNVSETSQVTLHLTTATLYQIFNFGSSLYDFTIIFSLVIGSLTSILVFAFVRVIGGTTAGLFAALIFSVSVPIFARGLIGWFKSEPLGLFFSFLALYLFISGIKTNKGKISLIKLFTAGFFLSLALSAWGGALFFLIGIAIFYIALPFLKKENNFLLKAAPVFSISLILFSLMFERTTSFIIGYAGILILLPTLFVVVSEVIKKFSNEKTKNRNCLIFLGSIVAAGIGILNSGLLTLPAFRYLNAINPFLTSTDPLTDSVAEHTTTNIELSFTFLSIFMVFALIGAWFIFSRKTINLKNDMRVFALIFSIIALYLSSAFVRLELFASVAILILSSIGLAILLEKIFLQKNQNFTKFIFPLVIMILFIIPVVLPENNAWPHWADFPPTILNGGALFSQYSSNDWIETLNWLKQNTSEDAVIASWWDYGYWITTLGERTTIVDNATLIDWQIKKMAFSLISTPEDAWHILNSDYSTDISKYLGDETILAFGGELQSDFEKRYFEENGESCKPIFKADAQSLGIEQVTCNPLVKGMDADYVIIQVIGERFSTPSTDLFLYTLEGGGDESKKAWMSMISNHQISKFVQSDGITPTPYFIENSTLGKLIPFSIIKYAEPNTGKTFDEYQDGLIPVYVKHVQYQDPENDPFFLVYASPSFFSQEEGVMSAVLIYKINSDYKF